MPATKQATHKRGPGRPATGKTKGVVKVTVNLGLIEECKKAAFQKGESFSQFVSRAMQTLLIS